MLREATARACDHPNRWYATVIYSYISIALVWPSIRLWEVDAVHNLRVGDSNCHGTP